MERLRLAVGDEVRFKRGRIEMMGQIHDIDRRVQHCPYLWLGGLMERCESGAWRVLLSPRFIIPHYAATLARRGRWFLEQFAR